MYNKLNEKLIICEEMIQLTTLSPRVSSLFYEYNVHMNETCQKMYTQENHKCVNKRNIVVFSFFKLLN